MLSVSHIYKSFGSLSVLSDFSLNVGRGEVVSVMGRSGVGKTTLLQILGTFLRPDRGTVTIDGTDVSALNDVQLARFRNRKIGYIFQSYNLLPEFTAWENILLPAAIAFGVSPADSPGARASRSRFTHPLGTQASPPAAYGTQSLLAEVVTDSHSSHNTGAGQGYACPARVAATRNTAEDSSGVSDDRKVGGVAGVIDDRNVGGVAGVIDDRKVGGVAGGSVDRNVGGVAGVIDTYDCAVEWCGYLVDMCGIGDCVDKFPRQLSGGQQQRVAIARALILNPPLILADEPTGNLDPQNQFYIMGVMDELHKQCNNTIIIATHNQELTKYADYNLQLVA